MSSTAAPQHRTNAPCRGPPVEQIAENRHPDARLILGVADSAVSQAIRNTGNAYVIELKEAWDDVSTTHTITGTSSPPYRYVWTLAPSGATPPLSELVDAYAYVRVHVKNLDTGVAQLLTVTLAITRYNT